MKIFYTLITPFFITLSISLTAQMPPSYLKKNIKKECNPRSWIKNELITSSEQKPSKTAVLIIAPPIIKTSNVELRWQLGKKVWEQYMNSHPNVDCYFLQSSCYKKDSKDTAWIEGNTIYVGDSWYENNRNDRILNKTIRALELLLPNYTHFFRTNLNTFFNLKNLHNYVEKHHKSMFTTPLWDGKWYPFGFSILFTSDVASHICKEYNRLEKAGDELVSCYHADDAILTSLATGIRPFNKPNPFKCCPSLKFGVRQLMSDNSLNSRRLTRYGAKLTPISSVNEAISFCELASPHVILFRTRDGLDLRQFAEFYDYIFRKTYPELPVFNFVEYINKLKNLTKETYPTNP